MKQSMAKFLRIICLVLAWSFCVLSIPMLFAVLPMFFICIGFAVAMFCLAHTIKKNYIYKKAVAQVINPSTSSVPDGQMNYNLFDDIAENSILSYEYETEFFLIENAMEHIKGNGGKGVRFIQEKDNPHDSAAVAIYLNDHKIGYIYRGGIQDMTNDWIERNHFFIGYINKYSVAEKKATIKIGFYKPLDSYPSIEVKLTKTNQKVDANTTRKDNLNLCDEGEEVYVEYSRYDETYIVYDNTYKEIGELAANGLEFCQENVNRKIVGIITKYDIDDNKYNVILKLFAVTKK